MEAGMSVDWQAVLSKRWRVTTERILRAVSDVTPEEAVTRPQDLAPIAWQVGHTVYYDALFLKRAGFPVTIPENHERLFPIGTDGRGDMPALGELCEVFRAVSGTIEALAKDPAVLARPIEDSVSYGSAAEGIVYLIGHRGYHLGKIMTLRALLGKPRLT